ncbi:MULTISPECIES: PadR family transcriptional regulator [Caproicibacterium]|uniref:PadR family transcriptional regulator n=1 Tax=Caproicibacterium argilliputei TaxID=3030016 RepID=A0AA97DAK7_9FIRM|nr:PadR family transcriptional regulator [Caproicibacterium argilliputei]WOC32063.1 PadR family transcriptional regulator [Caproicibacterium argilliputei]
MQAAQLRKGTLEGCILKIIQENETYGYEISERLRSFGFSEVSEGTIYPILLRLERSDLVTAQFQASAVGPKRKYFRLSASGETALNQFYENWSALEKAVNRVFGMEGNQTHESKSQSTEPNQ